MLPILTDCNAERPLEVPRLPPQAAPIDEPWRDPDLHREAAPGVQLEAQVLWLAVRQGHRRGVRRTATVSGRRATRRLLSMQQAGALRKPKSLGVRGSRCRRRSRPPRTPIGYRARRLQPSPSSRNSPNETRHRLRRPTQHGPSVEPNLARPSRSNHHRLRRLQPGYIDESLEPMWQQARALHLPPDYQCTSDNPPANPTSAVGNACQALRSMGGPTWLQHIRAL